MQHNVVLQEYIDLLEENAIIMSFEGTERLFKNLMEWQNNFRMWANNGHTPMEIAAMGYDSFWFSELPSLPTQSTPTISSKVGRNDPCPCGSGKKFKKCCGRYLSIV